MPLRHLSSWADRVRHKSDFSRFEPWQRCGLGQREETFMEGPEEIQPKIFAVKTTTGQERNVARLVAAKVEMNKIPVKAILVPEALRGYVFIEAQGPHLVEEAITGVKHVRSRIPGIVSFAEIERYIVKKPIIEELNENDNWSREKRRKTGGGKSRDEQDTCESHSRPRSVERVRFHRGSRTAPC